MACAACQQRRQIIAQAAQKEGAVGVVKALPIVVGHMIRTGRRPNK